MKSNIKRTDANNTPSIFVIFGATGDLATKKIIPSLWHLFRQGRLPEKISIAGFSRSEIGNVEFRAFVREAVLKRGGETIREEDISEFLPLFSYHRGTFDNKTSFQSLAKGIAETERSWGVCANKLFYLAVPPSSFGQIFKNLAAVKLNLPCGGNLGWSRVLIEKPFGTDLRSAKELQSLLSSYFKEEQIYRIDHYLFKEIVQGIKNFRFSNNLFENVWDNTTIERIDIRLLESVGVEERGSFYDSVGALRDVGQNHILTMLAILTMEYPATADVDAVRKSRALALEAFAPWTRETVGKNTYRAQYNGYKNIKGVARGSETETYFALKTEFIRPRWKGVPIFMEAGKRMAESRKEIVLNIKHPSICFLCETGPHAPNRIVFRLEPDDEIVIHFWTKKPGFEQVLEKRDLSFFLYEKETKVQYVEEYAKIIYAAMYGDRALFISPEEVEASWRFADPVLNEWKRNTVPLAQYDPDITPAPLILRSAPEVTRGETKKNESPAGEIGMIGLGKMGANLARRLFSKKWRVVGFNKTPDATRELESEGFEGAYSLDELAGKLSRPRTIWLMVPYQVVDAVLDELDAFLQRGDTVIDGGNSPYKESVRRAKKLAGKGINFLDVGVSGGPAGALNGASLMIGGERSLYEKYERLFEDLSVDGGYGYMGKSGAGHFVKMVHNGIEYGMMQAIGEGFDLLRSAKKYKLNLAEIADVYNHGSVIESRLVGWLRNAFELYGSDLKNVSGSVRHTGEGDWTVRAGKEMKVKLKIIEEALKFRMRSEKNPSYAGKVLSALRNQFGGHDLRNQDLWQKNKSGLRKKHE